MQVNLTPSDVATALNNHLISMGISLANQKVEYSFKNKRKPNPGLLAFATITPDVASASSVESDVASMATLVAASVVIEEVTETPAVQSYFDEPEVAPVAPTHVTANLFD